MQIIIKFKGIFYYIRISILCYYQDIFLWEKLLQKHLYTFQWYNESEKKKVIKKLYSILERHGIIVLIIDNTNLLYLNWAVECKSV